MLRMTARYLSLHYLHPEVQRWSFVIYFELFLSFRRRHVVVHWLQAFISKSKRDRAETVEEKQIPVIAHYKQAEVEGKLYKLGDCVHIHVSFILSSSLLQLKIEILALLRSFL
jgi:hypothetical protein